MASRKRSEWWLAFITVVGSLALCLVAAEVVLRFLPVSSGLRTLPVTPESPVFHFTPNRNYVFSRNWNLSLVNRGRVNNAGFVNDQDYRMDDEASLLAVVGDSYIEALMVPYAGTVHARLAERLAGRLRVYSFAASGAPLSQYLIWARHAVRDYHAQALLITIIGNDFDESLAAYSSRPGFWHYVPDAAGMLRLRLFEYRRGLGADLVAASALGRYVVFNLNMGPRLHALVMGSAHAEPHYFGNTAADAGAKRVSDSLAAIDAFFRDLAEVGLPPNRVLFAMDGFRYPQAAAAGAGSYFDQMRQAFRAKGEALGYEIIDLDPAFFARHDRTSERFEYPTDGHWNPAGHEVAFDAVMGSRLVKALSH